MLSFINVKSLLLLFAVCSFTVSNARPLPKDSPCDPPGNKGKNMFASRMKRSLDYQLCKKSKGEQLYCKKCICTWTYYYEAASLCFRSDPEYKARVKEEQQRWNDDSLKYCNRQAQEFSLDSKQDNFCGDGFKLSVQSSLALLTLLGTITLLW